METVGISPKVLASAIAGIVVFVVTEFGVSLDGTVEEAIAVVAMVVAGYLAPAGERRPKGKR